MNSATKLFLVDSFIKALDGINELVDMDVMSKWF